MKMTDPTWLGLTQARRLHLEPSQVLNAVKAVKHVHSAILGVFMQRNAGAFNLEDDEEGGEEEGAVGEGVGDDYEVEPVLDDLGLPEVDPARVNYPLFKREVWAAVDRAFGIEDVDMKDAITAKYDAFYKRRGAFAANLSLIATEWRNLEAQAVQFGVKILKKKKAEYLMNAVPLELQTILRITLKQEQHDPEAILHEIKELASAAGNSLVQVLAGKKPSKQVTRQGLEIALFAGPGEIGPRVPGGLRGRGRGHGRGNGHGRGGGHGGGASGRSSGSASEQPSRGGGQAGRGRGGLRGDGRGGSQSGQGSSGSTFKGKCHNCKQYGHKQADCPDLQQSSDRVGMVADRQGMEV
uniref:CCHC-type domain-containing protein n=1 Tax=Chromera velia CCMP2878 TaxID=1169474 RepID=A0A0G4G8G9_9ALVE|eukprot:Cvel_20765.t1-p1 / transcript=Cvel_20765.t1 / gene=Cvel_20765 / organism=Chromera_velia_CCMP2878 / gene_product=hypothetical protein / transcript_product=hypothetical protein / location=Cvel_scaffold1893:29963-31018(+) / protein_length=352 / sequence_SO=supercontig / SO=protein_coding / is_pseudo=false